MAFYVCFCRIIRQDRQTSCLFCRHSSTQAIPEPQVEGQDKVFPPKLHSIVDDIGKLTLTEVADLNELLKVKYQSAPKITSPKPQSREKLHKICLIK